MIDTDVDDSEDSSSELEDGDFKESNKYVVSTSDESGEYSNENSEGKFMFPIAVMYPT